MKAEQYQIFHDTKKKLEKVIDSCKTHQHISSTQRYYRLWRAQMKRILNLGSLRDTDFSLYSKFFNEIWSLEYLINKKWDEIDKEKTR